MMRSKCVADLNELGGGVMCLLQYSMALERILELMVLLTKIMQEVDAEEEDDVEETWAHGGCQEGRGHRGGGSGQVAAAVAVTSCWQGGFG